MAEPEAGTWMRIAALAEFDASRRLVREVNGTSILVQRLGADVVAVHNVCTHLGQPLAGGRIIAGQIICPFHGACFDLRSGAAVSGPAVAPLHVFPVRLENAEVFVDVSRLPASATVKPPYR